MLKIRDDSRSNSCRDSTNVGYRQSVPGADTLPAQQDGARNSGQKLMVDPYLLLQYRAVSWLPEYVSELAISETFFRALESDPEGLESDMYLTVWPFPQRGRAVSALRTELLSTLRDVECFSLGDAALDDSNRAVADALADNPDWYSRILADEWGAGHRPDAVRGHLLERAGDFPAARAAYESAAARTLSLPEQRYLQARAARLRP